MMRALSVLKGVASTMLNNNGGPKINKTGRTTHP
jgi:hypothetical protein